MWGRVLAELMRGAAEQEPEVSRAGVQSGMAGGSSSSSAVALQLGRKSAGLQWLAGCADGGSAALHVLVPLLCVLCNCEGLDARGWEGVSGGAGSGRGGSGGGGLGGGSPEPMRLDHDSRTSSGGPAGAADLAAAACSLARACIGVGGDLTDAGAGAVALAMTGGTVFSGDPISVWGTAGSA